MAERLSMAARWKEWAGLKRTAERTARQASGKAELRLKPPAWSRCREESAPAEAMSVERGWRFQLGRGWPAARSGPEEPEVNPEKKKRSNQELAWPPRGVPGAKGRSVGRRRCWSSPTERWGRRGSAETGRSRLAERVVRRVAAEEPVPARRKSRKLVTSSLVEGTSV